MLQEIQLFSKLSGLQILRLPFKLGIGLLTLTRLDLSISIQTTDDNNPRAKPGWNGPTGTGRESYSLEIDHKTRQELFDHYGENGIETTAREFDNLTFHDAYAGNESVRAIECDNTYLHYRRVTSLNSGKSTEDELVEPLLEAIGTSRETFESMPE